MHLSTMSFICWPSPGHHTDSSARALHFTTPRCPSWSLADTSLRIADGITSRVPFWSNPSSTVSDACSGQEFLSTGSCLAYDGHPSVHSVMIREQTLSAFNCLLRPMFEELIGRLYVRQSTLVLSMRCWSSTDVCGHRWVWQYVCSPERLTGNIHNRVCVKHQPHLETLYSWQQKVYKLRRGLWLFF